MVLGFPRRCPALAPRTPTPRPRFRRSEGQTSLQSVKRSQGVRRSREVLFGGCTNRPPQGRGLRDAPAPGHLLEIADRFDIQRIRILDRSYGHNIYSMAILRPGSRRRTPPHLTSALPFSAILPPPAIEDSGLSRPCLCKRSNTQIAAVKGRGSGGRRYDRGKGKCDPARLDPRYGLAGRGSRRTPRSHAQAE